MNNGLADRYIRPQPLRSMRSHGCPSHCANTAPVMFRRRCTLRRPIGSAHFLNQTPISLLPTRHRYRTRHGRLSSSKKVKTVFYIALTTTRTDCFTIVGFYYTSAKHAGSHTRRIKVLPRDTGTCTHAFPRPTIQSCYARSWVGRGSDVTNALCLRGHSFITYAQISGFQTHAPTLYAQIMTSL